MPNRSDLFNFFRNSLQEMILQDRVSSTPGKGSSGDFIKFLKGVAENIITMEKIVEITLFQFENFLKWLCLPNSSSVSDTAEMLETFCKHVNEATEEVLKDIAKKGEEKKDKPEKVKPKNPEKEQGMRISPGDLKHTGLKKVGLRKLPTKPAETSTADNELSAMLARFNRNRNTSENDDEDDDKGSEEGGEPTLTRTVRGVTIRRSKRSLLRTGKKASTSGISGRRGLKALLN